MSFVKKCVCMSAVSVLLLDTASAASSFASISEIKLCTPARWTQTYQTQWRTVDIDTAIEVPNVDQFPIIRITPREPIDAQLLANYAQVPTNASCWPVTAPMILRRLAIRFLNFGMDG